MRSVAVPDEVWARLDPAAGRLSRRDCRRVIAVCAAFITLIALVVAAAIIGVINPAISGSGISSSDNQITHRVSIKLHIEIGTRLDQHVTEVAISAAGVRLTEPIPAAFTIPGRDRRVVRLHLLVTDCSVVRVHDYTRVRVVTDHFWGHQTQTLDWDGTDPGGPAGDAWRACH